MGGSQNVGTDSEPLPYRDHCSLNQQTVGEMLQLAKNYDKVKLF